MKILIVDDDSFLRDMYVTKFTESGHTVAAATNGSEGLDCIKSKSFDVVLLDMVMPGMSGLDFLKNAVSQKPEAAETVFVVLSNQGEDTDKKAAKDAGAIGYIVKAESIPSDVVNKVEALCKKK